MSTSKRQKVGRRAPPPLNLSGTDVTPRADDDMRPEPYNTPESVEKLFERATESIKNGKPIESQ